jgi:biopolymer transport protein ExbB
MFGEIAASFQKGNPYLSVMLFLGFLGTAIIFERIIMLQFVYHLDFTKFLGNLRKLLTAEDTTRALGFCKSVSNTSLPGIARRALEAAETDPTTIRGAIEEETIDFLPRIESRIGFLMAVSTLILLSGVLGAIDSLWNTFHAISVLDTAQKQASLGTEIARALNPAAFGVLLSMFILVGYYIVRGMALRLTEKMHYGVTVLNNLLVPPEVANYMPVAMAAPTAAGGHVAAAAPSAAADAPSTTPTEGASADANFADASVEDIRDEEEII